MAVPLVIWGGYELCVLGATYFGTAAAVQMATPQGQKALQDLASVATEALDQTAAAVSDSLAQAKDWASKKLDGLLGSDAATQSQMSQVADEAEAADNEIEQTQSDSAVSSCPTCDPKKDDDDKPDSGKQDKKLSKGEIKKLKDNNIDPHDLKPKHQGSRYDLFKNRDGDILVKTKDGNRLLENTGININTLK